jgi:hypothetical protein
MNRLVGGQPLLKCLKVIFSLSIIKLVLKVPVIRILCLVIKFVVQIQSISIHKFRLNIIFNNLFSPSITYSMFKRIELPVGKDIQEV